MKNDLKYAYGTLRVSLSGIKFFYTRTCKRDWQVAPAKLQNVKSLPEVITRKQVLQIVAATPTQRMADLFLDGLFPRTANAGGTQLQVGDIDAERGMVHMHRGKGAKDRYVPLPTSTLRCSGNTGPRIATSDCLFPADGRSRIIAKQARSTLGRP